jgi:riboflavin kinase/FMN adenylyltransferase
MQIHQDIDQLPSFTKAVITVGTFDGVHIGHRTILARMVSLAEEIHGESVVITFHPHPRSVIGNLKQPVYLLHSIEEKIACLQEIGIHHLVIVPFTAAFAGMSAQAYIEDFLVKKLSPHTIIMGYDHQFGNNREGNFEMLSHYQKVHHFKLEEIPATLLQHNAVSSTKIRQALLVGDVETAHTLLTTPYRLHGIVVKGKQIGRTIGFPTANLEMTDKQKLIPANGVYITFAQVDDAQLPAVMNIGVKPTVSDAQIRQVEIHLLNMQIDLYGKKLTISLLKKIRDEQSFPSIEVLKQQIEKDVTVARAYFASSIHST